jgi:flagellar protein FliO/FliZ
MSGAGSPMRICGRMGLVCWAPLALHALPALAAGGPAPVVTAAPLISLLQVMLGLGLVLAAIAGSAWLLKRLGQGQVGATGALRVVAGVAVGPKERVVLVDVGEIRLVLGVAPGQVRTLHQMPRPADEMFSSPVEPMSSLFQGKLMALLNRKGGRQGVE